MVWTEQSDINSPATFLARRVDRSGQPLDAAAMVFEETGLTWRPRAFAASDGNDYLVAFKNSEGHLKTRRIARDGTISEPIHQAGFAWASDLCVAWTGTEYLVGHTVIQEASRFYTDIQVIATRFSREGVGIDARILGQYRTQGGIIFPSAAIACAAGQTGTLFVWNGDGGTAGAIVGHNGTLIAPLVLPTGASPAVASNGGRFLFASYRDGEIRRALVSEGGTVTVPNDAPIAADLDLFVQPSLSVSAMDDGFVLAFGTSDVHAVPLDGEGRARGPAAAVSATPGLDRAPAVAGGIIVYQRERAPDEWNVYARVLFEQARRRGVRH